VRIIIRSSVWRKNFESGEIKSPLYFNKFSAINFNPILVPYENK
jgi:methionine salvage enolase-phosphatase E1